MASRRLNVQRVSQLDSLHLDEELQSLLFARALDGFRFCPGGLVEKCRPELELIFRTFYFWQSIAKDTPSPGNLYQNLQYRNEIPFTKREKLTRFGNEVVRMRLWQKCLHFVIPILLRYAWTRLRQYATNQGWADVATSLARGRRTHHEPQDQHADRDEAEEDLSDAQLWWGTAWRAIEQAETVLKALEAFNYAVFLVSGKYRTVIDRIARTRLVYQDPGARRMVTFEFLNRQLVWEGFTEFVLFFWPLVTHPKFKRSISLVLRRLLPRRSLSTGRASDDDRCVVCRADSPTMPHVAQPCGHVYCYTCALHEMGVTEASDVVGHSCLSCVQRVRSFGRVGAQ